MKKVSTKIVMTGIVSLTILEIAALAFGINGKLFALVIGVIALAIGVAIPTPVFKK